MARYSLLVFTNAVAGQEAEFNEWYDRVHVPDLLAVPGVVAARRFEVSAERALPLPDGNSALSWRFLAIFELDTNDPVSVLADLKSRAGTDRMFMSPAMDLQSFSATLVQPI